MIRRLMLPVLALSGLGYAVFTVAQGSAPAPVAAPVAQPARPPFAATVAGAGIVEAASENIAVGSPAPRLALEIFARVGQEVDPGAPLFRLDDRDLAAELDVRRAAHAAAKARLDRLLASPRPEELPPLEARLAEAEAAAADLRSQLAFWESLSDKRAVSAEDLSRKRHAVPIADARTAQAKAQLALLKAGAWAPDVEVARAEAAAAEAQARAVESEIARLTVRAPVRGTVLKVNLRPGEFAPAGALAQPLLLLGTLDRLHVRVDIDENDAWRFRRDAPAIAFVRGNRDLRADLKFERLEPYVLPKRSLTGESSERVDTRVLQAIYSFDRSKLAVYVGQQMDVFVEAEGRK